MRASPRREANLRRTCWRARAIPLSKQGADHIALAHCCIRFAEYYWTVNDYEEVLSLYKEASRIYTLHKHKETKEYAHLLSWIAVAYMHTGIGGVPLATKHNELADKLVKKVFGSLSWELHRTMIDRVWLLQHSVEDTAESKKSQDTRKAFSMAERVETHATMLLNSLEGTRREDRVFDNALSELSVFAPKARVLLVVEDEPPLECPWSMTDRRRGARGAAPAAADARLGESPTGLRGSQAPKPPRISRMQSDGVAAVAGEDEGSVKKKGVQFKSGAETERGSRESKRGAAGSLPKHDKALRKRSATSRTLSSISGDDSAVGARSRPAPPVKAKTQQLQFPIIPSAVARLTPN